MFYQSAVGVVEAKLMSPYLVKAGGRARPVAIGSAGEGGGDALLHSVAGVGPLDGGLSEPSAVAGTVRPFGAGCLPERIVPAGSGSRSRAVGTVPGWVMTSKIVRVTF